LLCGYTPFDRDSNLEEMQAILDAEYSFTPEKYWDGVSDQARVFIRRCLTVDPTLRQTAHQALQHPWLLPADGETAAKGAEPAAPAARDLLPTVRKNFNARVKLHAAIDTIRAINQLRAAHMNGAKAKLQKQPPAHVEREVDPAVQKPGPESMEGVEGTGVLGTEDKMDVDR
jgi:calcium/calmodulin-dependent protein kinase I